MNCAGFRNKRRSKKAAWGPLRANFLLKHFVSSSVSVCMNRDSLFCTTFCGMCCDKDYQMALPFLNGKKLKRICAICDCDTRVGKVQEEARIGI